MYRHVDIIVQKQTPQQGAASAVPCFCNEGSIACMQEVMKASVSCCAAPHCPAFRYIGGATQDCSLRGVLADKPCCLAYANLQGCLCCLLPICLPACWGKTCLVLIVSILAVPHAMRKLHMHASCIRHMLSGHCVSVTSTDRGRRQSDCIAPQVTVSSTAVASATLPSHASDSYLSFMASETCLHVNGCDAGIHFGLRTLGAAANSIWCSPGQAWRPCSAVAIDLRPLTFSLAVANVGDNSAAAVPAVRCQGLSRRCMCGCLLHYCSLVTLPSNNCCSRSQARINPRLVYKPPQVFRH